MTSLSSIRPAARIAVSALITTLALGFAVAPSEAANPLLRGSRDAIGMSPAARGVAGFAPALRGMRDLGRLRGDAAVRIGIVMRDRHEAELVALTRQQGERGSRYYHRYLNNAQWNAYFAPDEARVHRVAYALEREGFRITRVAPNRQILLADAPARVAERYFKTELHRIAQTSGHGIAYANVTSAIMPAALRTDAVAVGGLHSTDVARYPYHASHDTRFASLFAHPNASTASPSPKPVTTSTPGPNPNPDPTIPGGILNTRRATTGGYGPFAFANAYNYPSLHGYNGRGQNVGNVISGDFLDSDVTIELQEFGFAHTGTKNRVVVDTLFVPATMIMSPDVGESTLDVEAILGLAPGANYFEYLINTLADVAILDGYNRVVSDNVVGVVNSSFGGCEQDDPSFGFSTNYIAMQGAAKGITFSASTGDTGGLGCNGVANGAPGTIPGVQLPSVDYYFTAVGGTDLFTDPMGSRTGEIGWTTGGGGVSLFESVPDWQANIAGISPTGRNVPDIALDAALETGYNIYQGGNFITGGTSLSSPLFAAMQTEVNQIQGSRHGWINPRLYEILAAQGYGFAFTDVVGGSNQTAVAVPGYDRVTGIGTPNGFALAGTE